MMATYKQQTDGSIRVLVDGKVTGTIRRFTSGWQYRPRNSNLTGDFFDTLEECKRSLELDEED